MANNSKSLNEMINEVVKSNMSRRAKVDALIKLGIQANEVSFVLPAVQHTAGSKAFKYTFGVEIETVGLNHANFFEAARIRGLEVMNHMHAYAGCHVDVPSFKLVPDGSVMGLNAAECVTPALDGTAKGFDALKACCNSLVENGAGVNGSCGLHVHIGAANLTDEAYINVFKNYKMLENVIDSFLAPSRRNSRWCKSIRNYDFGRCTTKADVLNEMNDDRYHKVNPCSYGRQQTIEFRQHQGSVNFTKIKMWVTFCAKLVAYSTKNVIEGTINTIDEIPFLTAKEKAFFEGRKAAVNGNRDREAA